MNAVSLPRPTDVFLHPLVAGSRLLGSIESVDAVLVGSTTGMSLQRGSELVHPLPLCRPLYAELSKIE